MSFWSFSPSSILLEDLVHTELHISPFLSSPANEHLLKNLLSYQWPNFSEIFFTITWKEGGERAFFSEWSWHISLVKGFDLPVVDIISVPSYRKLNCEWIQVQRRRWTEAESVYVCPGDNSASLASLSQEQNRSSLIQCLKKNDFWRLCCPQRGSVE